MPGFQYFIWRPLMEDARNRGVTVQERLFHQFYYDQNIIFHAYTQTLHPNTYQEIQRRTEISDIQAIVKGTKVPDWAFHNRRAVEFDWDSYSRLFQAMDEVKRDSTPHPHYGRPHYHAVQHYGNQRYLVGYWAQKLFFNETPRGDFWKGYYTREDVEKLDSFKGYSIAEKDKTPEDKQRREKDIARWKKLLLQHFPEFNGLEPITRSVKIEPYFDRNVEEIRSTLMIKHWLSCLDKNVFSAEEVQSIHEFFLHNRDEIFWQKNEEDDTTKGTELYLKFIKAMNLPNVFDINRFSGIPPEERYLEGIEKNYGIKQSTVDEFRKLHIGYLNQIDRKDLTDGTYKRIRALIGEEIYNPLFKRKISANRNDNGSTVAAVLRENGEAGLEKLETLYINSKQELHIFSKEVQAQFLGRVRNIAKTIPFTPQREWKNKI